MSVLAPSVFETVKRHVNVQLGAQNETPITDLNLEITRFAIGLSSCWRVENPVAAAKFRRRQLTSPELLEMMWWSGGDHER